MSAVATSIFIGHTPSPQPIAESGCYKTNREGHRHRPPVEPFPCSTGPAGECKSFDGTQGALPKKSLWSPLWGWV
jgi:hypothetical protein